MLGAMTREMMANTKSADEILQLLKNASEIKANLLLNIGPKGDGSIPEEDIKLISAGKKIKINQ